MQEFFFTVLAIWVIWRLFSSFSGKGPSAPNYQQTTHHHYYAKKDKAEGEVRIDKKTSPESKIPPTEGEYVDYEEIK
jgi:hypothetical protein